MGLHPVLEGVGGGFIEEDLLFYVLAEGNEGKVSFEEAQAGVKGGMRAVLDDTADSIQQNVFPQIDDRVTYKEAAEIIKLQGEARFCILHRSMAESTTCLQKAPLWRTLTRSLITM